MRKENVVVVADLRKFRPTKRYRIFKFKQRMINIIIILLNDADTRCHFCGKHFLRTDFPLDRTDNVCIHHIDGNHQNNNIDNLTLAHRECHKQYHAEKRKKKQSLI